LQQLGDKCLYAQILATLTTYFSGPVALRSQDRFPSQILAPAVAQQIGIALQQNSVDHCLLPVVGGALMVHTPYRVIPAISVRDKFSRFATGSVSEPASDLVEARMAMQPSSQK
jgi:hypothetical protein